MSAEGFWLFEGLEEEPYGLLPLVNLSGKGGPTSTKFVERVGSYQWYLKDEAPTIIVSGIPFLKPCCRTFLVLFQRSTFQQQAHMVPLGICFTAAITVIIVEARDTISKSSFK